jgi:hypothetical protein
MIRFLQAIGVAERVRVAPKEQTAKRSAAAL